MSDRPRVAPAGATRSLPPRANLEYERKRAKALLPWLRRDNPGAKLADAQFAVARELGFASWPRLVQYFGVLERESLRAFRSESHTLDVYDGQVRTLLVEHREQREWAGRALAAYVPRFYGRSIAEVLAAQVTEDDARTAVARQYQCATWDQLLRESAAERERTGDPWIRDSSPFMRAVHAVSERDLNVLEEIVGQHAELLHPSDDEIRRGRTIIVNALIAERRHRTPEARRVTDWLVSRGMELAHPLNSMLLGFHGITSEEVRYLLDRGGDVTWMPPNGVSVLEHAILRYWDGKLVDLIAQRVPKRPRGFWIAAGVGDVDDVRRYFDRGGKLTAAAYATRPPFDVIGPHGLPSLPEPDDLEILAEAALVAATNGRTAVIELLIDRGFPIDYTGWGGTSPLRFAIGKRDVSMVETLIKRGADLDKKGEWPHASAREFARQIVKHYSDAPEMPRILALCDAGTVDEALAEAERQRVSPPPFMKKVLEVFELAGDDAARRGQAEIRADNLFIGLLRGFPTMVQFLARSGVDLERLRAPIADRLLPAADRIARSKLPFDAESAAILERATAIGDERRYESVTVMLLLVALVEREAGFAAQQVIACGGSVARLLQSLGPA